MSDIRRTVITEREATGQYLLTTFIGKKNSDVINDFIAKSSRELRS